MQSAVLGGAAGRAPEKVTFKPSTRDVVTAIESLYADEVKPFGRILLKRLGERAAAADGQYPCVDAKRLRKLCERAEQVHVQPEDGGEYSVYLFDRPCSFVDVSSPHDPYPPELWGAAAAYFDGLRGDDACLPGGRYACAQLLAGRRLPFFAGLSVGQLCHVVQLAVSQRKLLGYLGHYMVPYAMSETMAKEHCASWQQPVCAARQGAGSLPCASLEEARACLRDILDSAADLSVPLPNVKRLFRSQYGLELSETVLGHTRLCELLQDVRFQDICTLRLQGNGYTVLRQSAPAAGSGSVPLPGGAREGLDERGWAQGAYPREPLTIGAAALPMARGPLATVPLAACGDLGSWSAVPLESLLAAQAAAGSGEPRPHDAWVMTGDAKGLDALPGQGCLDSTASTTIGLDASGARTPSLCSADGHAGQPLPLWPSEWDVSAFEEEPAAREAGHFEGLVLEPPAGDGEAREWPASLRQVDHGALLTPSALEEDGCLGSFVKNTFIHMRAPGSAQRRTQSLPKDTGSARRSWEASCHALLYLPKPAAGVGAAGRPAA